MTQEAINKLNEEFKQATKLSKKADAVKEYVLEALIMFCEQNEEFARAIVQTKQTISECIEDSVKGIGSASSDVDVYNKAVDFYFHGAKVRLTMTIDLGDEGFSNKQTSKSGELTLSLDGLLDF